MSVPAIDGLGPVVRVGDADVLVGTCSWADASLVKDSDWYPRRTMKAAQRLAYYASRFPLVSLDSTHYFPPTPELSESWVERTPAGFRFDVRAWSLLTGHPTFPHSFWEDLQQDVKPEFRGRRNLRKTPSDRYATRMLGPVPSRPRTTPRPQHSERGRLGASLEPVPISGRG